MSQKDLVVKLTINSKEFENGIQNAKSKVKDLGSHAVSLKSLTAIAGKFAGSLGLAISAANLLVKNMKDIETVSDAVGRSQKMLNESVKTFFVSLNSNNLSTFVNGLKEVVKAAKEAYDAIDNLGTYLNFSSADMAKNQAEQSKARYMIAAIKKGEEQGDLEYWQKELKRLAGEAENIIDKEVKHYEEAILASDRLLFAKFKGREKELSELKDKYTGTADKNEAAQNRYNVLAEQRKETIRLYGKNTNPNTARNSMYMDFMKLYGDELEFLEIIVKREKDLTEMNKLLISQENKKNTLYSERRTNLKYLAGGDENDGKPLKTTSSSSSAPASRVMTIEQQMEYLKNAMQNEILNDDRIKDSMIIDFEIPEEEIFEPETEALMEKVAEKMKLIEDRTKHAAVAMSAFGQAFGYAADLAGDNAFGDTLQALSGVANAAVSTASALLALTGAETMEGVAEAFASAPPYMKLAIAGTALAGILSMMATIKSSFAGSFANGGIVGGNSYTGDNLWARVNSGEMIIPYSDWHNASQSNVHFVIEGSQLVGVIDNYNKTQDI